MRRIPTHKGTLRVVKVRTRLSVAACADATPRAWLCVTACRPESALRFDTCAESPRPLAQDSAVKHAAIHVPDQVQALLDVCMRCCRVSLAGGYKAVPTVHARLAHPSSPAEEVSALHGAGLGDLGMLGRLEAA